MRKLILVFAVGVLLSMASLPAFADGGATTATTTTAAATTTTVATTTTSAQTTTTAPTSTAGTTTSTTATTSGNSGTHPHLHWFAGTVTGVGSSSLTVGVLWTGPHDGSLNGQTVTVAVLDQTRINGPHRGPIALAQIQVGDLVAVRAAGDPSSMTAAMIHVFCNCHWVGGTIASISPGASSDTGSLTVAVTRTGPYDTVLDNPPITLQVNADTVYLRGPHKGRLGFSDLKVGEGVGVVFSASGFFKAPGFDPTTATYTAKRVHVWGKRQVPPPSSDASSSASVSVT
jgi:hypothetical protein